MAHPLEPNRLPVRVEIVPNGCYHPSHVGFGGARPVRDLRDSHSVKVPLENLPGELASVKVGYEDRFAVGPLPADWWSVKFRRTCSANMKTANRTVSGKVPRRVKHDNANPKGFNVSLRTVPSDLPASDGRVGAHIKRIASLHFGEEFSDTGPIHDRRRATDVVSKKQHVRDINSGKQRDLFLLGLQRKSVAVNAVTENVVCHG